MFFFFSSRRRHTRWNCDWSSDVCSSDLEPAAVRRHQLRARAAGDHGHDLPQPRRAVHAADPDRKSTRLNSSHSSTSYAVFSLKTTKCNIRGSYECHSLTLPRLERYSMCC